MTGKTLIKKIDVERHVRHRLKAWCRTSNTSCRAVDDSLSYEPRRPWNGLRLQGMTEIRSDNASKCVISWCIILVAAHHRPTLWPHTPRRPATEGWCHWQSSSQTAGIHTSLPGRNTVNLRTVLHTRPICRPFLHGFLYTTWNQFPVRG